MVSARSSGGSARNSIGGSWNPACGSGRRAGAALRIGAAGGVGGVTASATSSSGGAIAGRGGGGAGAGAGAAPICSATGWGASETRRFTE